MRICSQHSLMCPRQQGAQRTNLTAYPHLKSRYTLFLNMYFKYSINPIIRTLVIRIANYRVQYSTYNELRINVLFVSK
jgi:hypothetical protein